MSPSSAYHEAGHAVVGTVFNHPLRSAVAFKGGGGVCTFKLEESRCSTVAGMAMIIAGQFAAEMSKGRSLRFNYLDPEDGDPASIRAILATLHPGIRGAITENAEAFARAALELYWDAVVEVAHELDRNQAVIGSWVARLVRPTTLRVVGGKE